MRGEKNRSTDHRLLIKKTRHRDALARSRAKRCLSPLLSLFASQPRKKPFAFSLSSPPSHHRPPSRYLLEGAAYLLHLIANESSLSFYWIFWSFSFLLRVHADRGCKNIGIQRMVRYPFHSFRKLGREERRKGFFTGKASLKGNLLNRLLIKVAHHFA